MSAHGDVVPRRAATRVTVRVLAGVLLAALVPTLVSAQGSTRRLTRADVRSRQVCDMRYKLLMLTVVDRSGAPVPGVTVEIPGFPASPEGPREMVTSDSGEVQVAEDLDLQRLPKAGATYTATLRKGATVRRVRLRFGPDAAGCHIALLSGPSTIRF